MDVVFALVIWQLFALLPAQEVDGEKWVSVTEMLNTVFHPKAINREG